MSAFLDRLVAFGRLLREGGLEVGPGRLQDALVALTAVDVTVREDVYWAMRCALCSHHDHLEVFDVAFEDFWRVRALRDVHVARAEPRGVRDEEGGGGDAARAVEREVALDAPPAAGSEHGQGASPAERLHRLDFREYGPQEIRDARELVARIARSLPRRRSLRLAPAAHGRHLDPRRTLREAMRTGGDPVQRAWRENRVVPRRTVFLLDISGSMEPYARMMVMFAQAAVRAGRSVEAFAFGTRLTRLTEHLGAPDPDRALDEASRAVPDWAGGTRIGANLEAFNDVWGRRGLSRGALVIVVSDGWERGDVAPLARATAALQRSAHTVVWVNPVAGDPRYRPLAAGMAAALPSIDVFMPGHNLAALSALSRVLEALPERRARSRRRSGSLGLTTQAGAPGS